MTDNTFFKSGVQAIRFWFKKRKVKKDVIRAEVEEAYRNGELENKKLEYETGCMGIQFSRMKKQEQFRLRQEKKRDKYIGVV